MTSSEPKVDPTKAWWKTAHVWWLVVGAVFVTGYWFDTRSSINDAIRVVREATDENAREMKEQAVSHQRDIDRVVDAVQSVEQAVNKLILDTVATRQANTWIEMHQVLWDAWVAKLAIEFPEKKIPPFKVNPLPR